MERVQVAKFTKKKNRSARYTVFNRAHGDAGQATVGFAESSMPSESAQTSVREHNELQAWRKMAWERKEAALAEQRTQIALAQAKTAVYFTIYKGIGNFSTKYLHHDAMI